MNSINFSLAADLIAAADALLITAGAGIGVDSGLPDFRGTDGFWRAYPALRDAQITFEDIANPRYFATDPELAWGFYGHRLALYRRTEPHAGFKVLRAIATRMPQGAFVFTSNVDGQFQKAGFPESQFMNVTARFTGCNASHPVATTGHGEQIYSIHRLMPAFADCETNHRPARNVAVLPDQIS